MGIDQNVSEWRFLASEAAAGRLYLDPSVAKACADACEALLIGLDDLQTASKYVQKVDGFGGFDSGADLTRTFTQRGVGDANSIDEVIREHFEVVTLIRDTILGVVKETQNQDHAVAEVIGQHDVHSGAN